MRLWSWVGLFPEKAWIEPRQVGYTGVMPDPRLADHAIGVELQIIELVEQRERAKTQHRSADAARIQNEIDDLQEDLAEHRCETLCLTDAVPW